MSSLVFQKTEKGRAEIGQRAAGLSVATRSVLIMVNGVDAVSALMARGLPQLQGHLDTLLALGLIEPLDRPTPVALPPPVSVSLPPLAPPPVHDARPKDSPPAAVPSQPQLEALRRRALAHLSSHFGPDTPLVAQALLVARTTAEFNAALDGIESKLAIYMGRKQAARELLALRPAN